MYGEIHFHCFVEHQSALKDWHYMCWKSCYVNDYVKAREYEAFQHNSSQMVNNLSIYHPCNNDIWLHNHLHQYDANLTHYYTTIGFFFLLLYWRHEGERCHYLQHSSGCTLKVRPDELQRQLCYRGWPLSMILREIIRSPERRHWNLRK